MPLNITSPFSKFQNTKKRLRKLSKRSASCQFCFRYIFLYLFSKDSPFDFNPRGVQLLEELVIAVLPGICAESDSNFKTICYILFSFYEIFFRDLEKSVHVISARTRHKSSACTPY